MRFHSLLLRKSCGFLFIFVLLGACAGEQCETVQEPVMRVSFARFTNAERTTEQALSVSFDYIKGVDSEANPPEKTSLVKDKDTTSISGLQVRLSKSKDNSVFAFKRKGLAEEKVKFIYIPKPYFLSQACGFRMSYENLEVEEKIYTNIVEVRVVQPSVNAQNNNVNVKIYFR